VEYLTFCLQTFLALQILVYFLFLIFQNGNYLRFSYLRFYDPAKSKTFSRNFSCEITSVRNRKMLESINENKILINAGDVIV